MGKRNRAKERGRETARDRLAAVLQEHTCHCDDRRPAACYDDIDPADRAAIESYRAFWVRAPETWRCRVKSRRPEKRFVDLVSFVFARYRAPVHLENVWINGFDGDFVDRLRTPTRDFRREGADLRQWYVLTAQGRSLYREAAHPYLSRAETHHFVSAPAVVTCARSAFWYAIVAAQAAGDTHLALRIARTKLRDLPIGSSFWREVARYFAKNQLSIAEMDDLIDFFAAAREENESFSLKGRGVPALQRRMEEWHRALRKRDAICGGAWAGRPIPDVEYTAGSKERRAIWRFSQIKTGNALFREGQRMRHCVASYKSLCLRGEVSIWSLTCEYPLGIVNKGVTIEVRRDGAIVQCRGFANRLPYANEVSVLKRWADEYGLACRAHGL